MSDRWNFGGLPEEQRQRESAFFGVVPVPFERTTSYGKGTARGPAAIVEASHFVELFDEVFEIEAADKGIWTAPPFFFGHETIDEDIHHIQQQVEELLKDQKFWVFLGGEHAITYPIVSAFCQKFSDLSVLQIDAHADLRDEYEGSVWSHASVMRRVVGICPAVQVGIRSMSREEFQVLPELNTQMFFAHEYFTNPSQVIEKMLEKLHPNVYISFDIDGIDPSLVPHTGTPEPGGLFWKDAMDILRAVFSKRHVVGADVVELAPESGSKCSDFTAAKLAYKMMTMAARFNQ